MAMKDAKIEKIDETSFKLDKESKSFTITKKFKSLNLKVGDPVKYEIKGPNINIEKGTEETKKDGNGGGKTGFGAGYGYGHKTTEIKADMSQFIYPFNFVSLGDENEIEESRGPIKKGDYSGKIVCTLTNLTPISIGSEKSTEFIKFKDKYVIPASSLKGEIRNIVEILTTSCIKNIKEKHLYKKIPEKFKPCKNTEHLCFACRLFGSTGNDMEEMSVSQNSYRGRVFFSDAVINKNVNTLTLSFLLGGPRVEEGEPAMRRFYTTPSGKIRGRKFFWHQKKLFSKNNLTGDFPQSPKKVMSTVSCIDINHEFKFEVHFEKLTAEELGVLVYALELEKGLLHKFGRAKAYGFGSCEIKVKDILLDSADKYQSFISSTTKDIKFLDDIKKKYINSTKNHVNELKAILAQVNKVSLGYPKPFPDRNALNKFKGKTLPKILEYK